MKIWECKIGEVPDGVLPRGADSPMRKAVEAAYKDITGQDAQFCFSGWGGELTESERAVVEDREPRSFSEPAKLGLATTRDLLNELRARADVDVTTGLHGVYAALVQGTMVKYLDELPQSMLDYRTVDGR